MIRRTTYCKPLNISWRKRWLVATGGLDLERTVIRAPADGWVTNLNVYTGEFITRGSTAVALVKENTFYVMAYLEETKLEGVRPGYRAEITRWAAAKPLKGRWTVSLRGDQRQQQQRLERDGLGRLQP